MPKTPSYSAYGGKAPATAEAGPSYFMRQSLSSSQRTIFACYAYGKLRKCLLLYQNAQNLNNETEEVRDLFNDARHPKHCREKSNCSIAVSLLEGHNGGLYGTVIGRWKNDGNI